jgi:FkbM family methyltransferase
MDVGANVGWFSLHFAAWVGASGRVIACEADPDVVEELRENCRLNGWQDVIDICNSAVADAAGTVTFTRSPPEHSGWGSLLAQEGNRGGESIGVPAITLDSIIEARGIQEVDMLKIDVEGYEFAVLHGAADALRRRIFRHVLIEWAGEGQTSHGRTINEMQAIFDRNGYEPDQATARLIDDFRCGNKDAHQTFANLMYGRINRNGGRQTGQGSIESAGTSV